MTVKRKCRKLSRSKLEKLDRSALRVIRTECATKIDLSRTNIFVILVSNYRQLLELTVVFFYSLALILSQSDSGV